MTSYAAPELFAKFSLSLTGVHSYSSALGTVNNPNNNDASVHFNILNSGYYVNTSIKYISDVSVSASPTGTFQGTYILNFTPDDPSTISVQNINRSYAIVSNVVPDASYSPTLATNSIAAATAGLGPGAQLINGIKLTYTGNYTIVPSGNDASSYIPDFKAPNQTLDVGILDAHYGLGSATETGNAIIPQYVWVDVGLAPSLFTVGYDNIDFNLLIPSQQQAIAAGDQPSYNGQGGSDTITLPDANHFNASVGSGQTLHWMNDTVFTTGSHSGNATTINVPVGQPTSVAYHVVLGDGTDTVNMASQGGVLVVDAGYGNAVLNLSGSGKTTLNVAPEAGTSAGTETVSVAALAADAQLTIHFAGKNENVKITGAETFLGKIHVSGMTVGSNNSISFDVPNLNSGVIYGNSVANYTKAEDLYATPRGRPELYLTGPGADHHTATLVFDDGDINQVKPQTDGATTKLVVESSTTARTIPAGSGSIDWSFIRAQERYELQPYVPGPTSGVTIGSGVDLAKSPSDKGLRRG